MRPAGDRQTAGLVVHPGAGNPRHTLQNALLAHDRALALVPRAGLITGWTRIRAAC